MIKLSLKLPVMMLSLLLVMNFLTYAEGVALSIAVSERQMCDLELLLNRGFSPLDGFMDSKSYHRVVHQMRLLDGTLWPIPIVFDVTEEQKLKLENVKGSSISLCDQQGTILALLEISEIWRPDKLEEARCVYGTTSRDHPGVEYLLGQTGEYYVAGKLTKVSLPKHWGFPGLYRSPDELKEFFKEKGWDKIVAFQTRNPMHRAHVELTLRAAQKSGAHLLLHPAVGKTKPGDVDAFTRIKCYLGLLPYYPDGLATLSLLPIAMRMAGPREALWHAIIRKNYGCTHFIVGRDHAGPGKDREGKDFYAPYAAQDLLKAHSEEMGIEIVCFNEMVYVQEDDNYQTSDEVDPSKTIMSISGTQLREMLKEGSEIPSWFTFPEVVAELRKAYPPRLQQGFTLFFTGLSAAGKSTIASAVTFRLMEIQDRPITLLDGDLLRKNLSSELGFSKEHRSLNVRRVGFVASEITKNRGVAICALIAPYEDDRLSNRNLINVYGNYIEIYISTPLAQCEQRDPKNLYSLARQGKITGFTGVDDPYEVPKNPEITIDTTQYTVSEAVDLILHHLREKGFL